MGISPSSAASPALATASAQAVRLGAANPRDLLAEVYPAELLDGDVVIGYASLDWGVASVPWDPSENPACAPARRAGECILIDRRWSRWNTTLQRIYLAHEWAHVLASQVDYYLMGDECLAEEIAEQAVVAAGFPWADHYVCPNDLRSRALAVTEELMGHEPMNPPLDSNTVMVEYKPGDENDSVALHALVGQARLERMLDESQVPDITSE